MWLTVLKIILLILLTVLLIVLLLILLILFLPIRYNIHAKKEGDNENGKKGENGEIFFIRFNAEWLFRFVNFRFRFDKKGISYKGKVLWRTLISRGDDIESGG